MLELLVLHGVDERIQTTVGEHQNHTAKRGIAFIVEQLSHANHVHINGTACTCVGTCTIVQTWAAPKPHPRPKKGWLRLLSPGIAIWAHVQQYFGRQPFFTPTYEIFPSVRTSLSLICAFTTEPDHVGFFLASRFTMQEDLQDFTNDRFRRNQLKKRIGITRGRLYLQDSVKEPFQLIFQCVLLASLSKWILAEACTHKPEDARGSSLLVLRLLPGWNCLYIRFACERLTRINYLGKLPDVVKSAGEVISAGDTQREQ